MSPAAVPSSPASQTEGQRSTLAGRIPASSTAAIEAALDTLRQRRSDWAGLPILERIDLLRKTRRSFAEVADEWVAACIEAEGQPEDEGRLGEEWLVGPYFILRNLRLLQIVLRNLSVAGHPRVPGPVKTLPDGKVSAQVFPFDLYDRIFYPGVVGEVWMQDEVTEANLREHQAAAYREDHPGAVALVLSAGNVSSIGPMDALYKLFVDRQTVVFKIHEVNDYLGPLIERGFRPLIEAGFFRLVYGGANEGAYLCDHDKVDSIHITGSDRTYEAIVFGAGEEGARRKEAREPRLTKPITAELGNVSPVIVIPGPWSAADIDYHAENVASMLANNAGFNCNALRVLITWEGWLQRGAFLDAVRRALARITPRQAYYPGAQDRYDAFVEAHPEAERFGDAAPNVLPWTLIPGLDATKADDICFQREAFCSLFGETALAAEDPESFLDGAVRFCNDELWGTLNATLLVHPETASDAVLGPAVERAVRDLRYGSVAINHWAAIAYAVAVTPWGAYPGHPPHDIQSGTGVVHNVLMFDRVEKTVFRAPFRAHPKPPWFLSHRTAYELCRKLTHFEISPSPFKLPGIFNLALRG